MSILHIPACCALPSGGHVAPNMLFKHFWWLKQKRICLQCWRAGSIPGSGRSPGEGNGNPLQYSYLGNSMDRGTWWASIHGVAKSQTWLTNTLTLSPNFLICKMVVMIFIELLLFYIRLKVIKTDLKVYHHGIILLIFTVLCRFSIVIKTAVITEIDQWTLTAQTPKFACFVFFKL